MQPCKKSSSERALHAYLDKQSTETLDAILHICLHGDNWRHMEEVIQYVLDILAQREDGCQVTIPPGALEFLANHPDFPRRKQ